MNDKKLDLLRLYIREQIDLGQVQFGPDRVDIDPSMREPNTPEEQKLYVDLKKRVVNGGSLSPSAAKDISDLISSKKYGIRGSGFFRGPLSLGQPLMRGHVFDSTWARKYLTIPFEQIPEIKDPGFDSIWKEFKAMGSQPNTGFKTPYKFRQRRGWSPDPAVCVEFAGRYGAEMMVKSPGEPVIASIIFMYPEDNDPDSLLDFTPSVYQTWMGRGFKDEKEVLNLKPVVCRSAAVMCIKPK